MWVPRIELWSSGLETNPFVCCAILSAFRLTAFLLRLSNQQLPGIHGSHITKNNQGPAGLESLFHSLFVAGASKLWGFLRLLAPRSCAFARVVGLKACTTPVRLLLFDKSAVFADPTMTCFWSLVRVRKIGIAATSHMCLLSTQSMALQLGNWYLSICLSLCHLPVCLSLYRYVCGWNFSTFFCFWDRRDA